MAGLYARLQELAALLSDYLGVWRDIDGITGNDLVAKQILHEYTQDEIGEATKMIMKRIADSK